MNKGIIFLEVLRNDYLSPGAKIFFGEITACCDKEGIYVLNTENKAIAFNTTKETIKKWCAELIANEFVCKVTCNNLVEQLKAKNMKGLGFGNNECEWCNVKTSVLHKHHYPIPKSEGGTDIVNICPNCHHEFHYHTADMKLKLNISDEQLQYIINNR